jgi:hypothetical protein
MSAPLAQGLAEVYRGELAALGVTLPLRVAETRFTDPQAPPIIIDRNNRFVGNVEAVTFHPRTIDQAFAIAELLVEAINAHGGLPNANPRRHAGGEDPGHHAD